MYYANIKNYDSANGPGVRVSLFVSGCNHHCKNCFNREAWDFHYGKPFTQETVDELIRMLSPKFITGLTLLGGEPFDPLNQPSVLAFLKQVREKLPEKTIWGFTGYVLENDLLQGRACIPGVTREYLELLDVLVDGPFIEEQKNISLRFRGSENQRLIDMKKTLAAGKVVLWEDWQVDGRGMNQWKK